MGALGGGVKVSRAFWTKVQVGVTRAGAFSIEVEERKELESK